MKIVKTLVLTILFIFAITFAMENNERALIYYPFNFFEPVTIPVFLIVMVSILIGILLVGFIGIFERIRLKVKLKKQAKRIEVLEEELSHLRSLSPVKTDDYLRKEEI